MAIFNSYVSLPEGTIEDVTGTGLAMWGDELMAMLTKAGDISQNRGFISKKWKSIKKTRGELPSGHQT